MPTVSGDTPRWPAIGALSQHVCSACAIQSSISRELELGVTAKILEAAAAL